MIAVDTNVLVRLLTGDEPKQTAAARSLFAQGPIWIAKTVLIETCWVLKSVYTFDADAISNAFTNLLGLGNVTVEDPRAVSAALAIAKHGVDFADAIHLTSTPAGAIFVSFDKSFVQRARRAGVSDIAWPPPAG